jgi:acetyltransferase-like isoleucine patch superfamily enzyme
MLRALGNRLVAIDKNSSELDTLRKAACVTKIWKAIWGEFSGLRLRLILARLLCAALPVYTGNRLRAGILRAAGFAIGPGTFLGDMPSIIGTGDIYIRFRIGGGCWINVGCLFDLSSSITIGDQVALGPQVTLLTSTHVIGSSTRRTGPLQNLPVTIGDGCWLGARCTILPGVTIGQGAVVAAGAMVHRDVPPNTLVAGVPARVIKMLS